MNSQKVRWPDSLWSAATPLGPVLPELVGTGEADVIVSAEIRAVVPTLFSADASGAGLWVFPQGAHPISTEIAELARTRGWAVTGLYVERGHLDDVFRNITAPAPAPETRRDAA